MIPAGLSLSQVQSILKANKYELLSDRHWEEEGVERLVFGKDGHTFVIKAKAFFLYPEVVKRLHIMLEVTNIPTDCQEDYACCITAYYQHKNMMLEMQLDEKEIRQNNVSGDPKEEE